jgi:hypothetical protein
MSTFDDEPDDELLLDGDGDAEDEDDDELSLDDDLSDDE